MNTDTDSIILERLMIYQNDLICCLESKNRGDNTASDNDRMKQDKAIIEELKRIFYKNGLDGLVYIDP